MKKSILLAVLLIIVLHIFAFDTEYELIDPYSQEWQDAGLESDIPVHDISFTINTTQAETLNIDSLLVDYQVTPSATNIVRFLLPSGEFTLNAPIELRPYVILKGNHQFRRDEDRGQRTILNFNLGVNKNCINVGSSTEPMEKVGIEDLWIVRDENGSTDNSGHGLNMHFMYSRNCWVIGVESTNPVSNHLRMINSEHNYVAGCYFDDAQNHGEGGNGYGVFIEYDSHHILVENNIFRKLRHSMVVQNGAHHNVFGYNTVKKLQKYFN